MVSVCIPTFNQGAYLPLAIKSVLSQDYDDLEVVVSDNHSTDGTSEYLATVRDSRVRVVRPEQHLPMADNWRFSVRQSSGKYFNVLCSDDMLLPGYVKKLVQVLDNFPTVAFVHCAARFIDAEGRSIGIYPLERRSFCRDGKEEFLRYLFVPRCILSTMMIRRGSYDKVGGFGAWRYVGDWDLELRLLQVGDVAFHDEVLAQYRIWSTPLRTARIIDHLVEIRDLYETTVAGMLRTQPELSCAARKARSRRALAWALQLRHLVEKENFELAAQKVMSIDNGRAVRLALKMQRSQILSSLISTCIRGRWRFRHGLRSLIYNHR